MEVLRSICSNNHVCKQAAGGFILPMKTNITKIHSHHKFHKKG
jgi:hypothetical protein